MEGLLPPEQSLDEKPEDQEEPNTGNFDLTPDSYNKNLSSWKGVYYDNATKLV